MPACARQYRRDVWSLLRLGPHLTSASMLPCRHEFLVVAGLASPFNCSPQQAAAVDRAGSASAAIRDLAHSPQQPKSGEPVTVTARVASSNGLPALTLRVQVVEPGDYVRKTDAAYERSWRDFPMQEEAKSSDAGGADRTFTAVFPAEIQKHRSLLR